MSSIRRKFEAARDRAAELAKIDDRTDEQNQELADQLDRAEALKADLEAEAEREERLNALAAVNRSIALPGTPSDAPVVGKDMSAGEFLSGFYQAYHPNGSATPQEFLDRAAKYIDRATQATADTAGILPAPIVGPIVKLADSRRPAFVSLSSKPMPAKGKTFERPYITQRVTMGTQTEGSALSSQKMVVASDTVTKATQGGTLDITQQDIDWTEPSALESLVQDFVDTYAEWTEGLATDFIESMPVAADTASNGDGYSAWDATDVGTIVTSVIDGIVDVYGRSKRVADTFWMDLAGWAVLAGTTNADDDVTALEMIRRAVRDLQGEMGGGSGFRFVVSPEFAANTRIIGASSLGEAYENQNGLLRANNPGNLSVTMAYSGYTAFWGKHQGFVQLGADPSA
jgi:hypothetical protein